MAAAVDPTDKKKLFTFDTMSTFIQDKTESVKTKLKTIQDAGDEVSISAMFDMQMQMNELSQMSEMSTAVVAGANTAVLSMARNIK